MGARSKKKSKTRPRAGRPGLTLIEVLISLVITSILVLAVLSLYTMGHKYFMNQTAAADILEDSSFPLVWIARDVKSAVRVAAAYSGYATSADVLVLQVPAIDSGGLIIDVDNDFDYIVYRRSGRMAERILIAVPPSARTSGRRFLSDNVVALSFTYFDSSDAVLTSGFSVAARVKADVATNVRGAQTLLAQSLNSTFKLRNR
jgi:prepilin-type N-terminal cleavage/methylation domain-containing protein